MELILGKPGKGQGYHFCSKKERHCDNTTYHQCHNGGNVVCPPKPLSNTGNHEKLIFDPEIEYQEGLGAQKGGGMSFFSRLNALRGKEKGST